MVWQYRSDLLEDDKLLSVSRLAIYFEQGEELILLGINIILHDTKEVKQDEAH
jgi:hypothetical protein